MHNIIEIPVTAQNQQFDIRLSGKNYRVRLIYRSGCGWVADVTEQGGGAAISGVPLTSGVDILEQYRHLGFAGSLVFVCGEDAGELSHDDFGRKNRLYYSSGGE